MGHVVVPYYGREQSDASHSTGGQIGGRGESCDVARRPTKKTRGEAFYPRPCVAAVLLSSGVSAAKPVKRVALN